MRAAIIIILAVIGGAVFFASKKNMTVIAKKDNLAKVANTAAPTAATPAVSANPALKNTEAVSKDDCFADISNQEMCREEESKLTYLETEGALDKRYNAWKYKMNQSTFDPVQFIGLGRALAISGTDFTVIKNSLLPATAGQQDQELIADGWGFGQIYDKKSKPQEAVKSCDLIGEDHLTKACLFGLGKAISFMNLKGKNDLEIPSENNNKLKWIEMGYGFTLGFMDKNLDNAPSGHHVNLGVKDGKLIRDIYLTGSPGVKDRPKMQIMECIIGRASHHALCFANE